HPADGDLHLHLLWARPETLWHSEPRATDRHRVRGVGPAIGGVAALAALLPVWPARVAVALAHLSPVRTPAAPRRRSGTWRRGNSVRPPSRNGRCGHVRRGARQSARCNSPPVPPGQGLYVACRLPRHTKRRLENL